MIQRKAASLQNDKTRYAVRMDRQELKVREGPQIEGVLNQKPVFVTKFPKYNEPKKSFIPIPPGFFSTKNQQRNSLTSKT